METRYFIKEGEVVAPNRPIRIYERTVPENTLVGAYDGYWNPSMGYYTLYPKFDPHVWRLKKNVKHKVSDRLVLLEAQPLKTCDIS